MRKFTDLEQGNGWRRFIARSHTLFATALFVLGSATVGCAGSTGSQPATISAASALLERTRDTKSTFIHGHLSVTHLIVQPPFSGVYLGAQVNPSDGSTATPQQLEKETEDLESPSEMNRHLALHLQYRNWTAMANLAKDPGIVDDLLHNRLPVISWTCADDLGVGEQPSRAYNLMDIAAGYADADLAKIRKQLLALPNAADGKPAQAMLRWFWEFNINASNPPGYINTQNTDIMNAPGINGNDGCFVKPGTPVQVPGEALYAPALNVQFIGAWEHIHDQLVGVSPAAPVTFVWNPNVGGIRNENVDPAPYYPPDASYVDWIAADGYDKEELSSPFTPVGFTAVFTTWYNEFSGYGKPLMIGETGACDGYNYPTDQGSYIDSISSGIQIGSNPVFPKVNAVNYFDAPGSYPPADGKTICHFAFSSDSKSGHLSGLASFISMGNDYYFTPFAL